MASDDDLRDKLTEELYGRELYSLDTAQNAVRQAWPRIRDALADAWDDGLEHAGGGTPTDLKANPWRQP